MKTPSREVLDQYVYEIGFNEAIKFFDLSEAKANSILFDKITTKLPERFQYVEPTSDEPEVPELSKDFNKLKNVLCRDFKKILDTRHALDSRTIDARSMSPYDRAMEVLTDILYYNADFVYRSDEQTREYIDNRLRTGIQSRERAARREEKLLEFNEEIGTELCEQEDTEAEERVLSNLTPAGKEAVVLLMEGYKQEEIADKLNISQPAVSYRFAVCKNKLSA